MPRPPRRILVAIAAVATLALLALAGALIEEPASGSVRLLVLAPQLCVLLFLARRFPLQLAPKTKTSVATAPTFAAAILLPLPLAMLLCALATIPAEIMLVSPTTKRRPPWFQVVFNASSLVLKVGASAKIFSFFGHTATLTDLSPGPWLWAAPLAALSMYTIDLVLVDIIVALTMGRRPLLEFWRRWSFSLPSESAMLLLGLLVATVAARLPYAVGLMAVPSYVVYRSLRDGIALEVQTREALLELADIVDMRDHYTYEHSRRVAELARVTALKLRLPSDTVEMIYMAGRVHDVGKIGIKSTVLMKPTAHGARVQRNALAPCSWAPAWWPSSRSLPGAKSWCFPTTSATTARAIPAPSTARHSARRSCARRRRRLGRHDLAPRLSQSARHGSGVRRDGASPRHAVDRHVLDAFLEALGENPELALPHTAETQDIDSFAGAEAEHAVA